MVQYILMLAENEEKYEHIYESLFRGKKGKIQGF
jgi:hypothetical protein